MTELAETFLIKNIPEELAAKMQQKNIWTPDCPVSLERLKLLEVRHYDFSGEVQTGKIIVLDKVAENVITIFKEIFSIKFPIYSIKTIDEFGGDDELAMQENNSSAFNFRPIAGTKTISMHSYGLAIDINPLQNPYLVIDEDSKDVTIHPKKGADYLNRSNIRPGMVEQIVPILRKHGFTVWGGEWNTPIDYHHFQVPRDMVADYIK